MSYTDIFKILFYYYSLETIRNLNGTKHLLVISALTGTYYDKWQPE